jgi:hypothetical protein
MDRLESQKKQLLMQYMQTPGTFSIDNFGTISGSSSIVQPSKQHQPYFAAAGQQ